MSVTEYQREFTRLSKYAPEILVSEEERCRKFEDGLNDHIRAHVTGFCHEDFSKIVTCALNIERVKNEENERKERRQGKKMPGQSSAYQHQSKKFKGPQGSNQPTAQATGNKSILPIPSVASAQGGASKGQVILHCPHCGRNHKGECWKLTGACLVMDLASTRRKTVLEHVPSQQPKQGVIFPQYRKAVRVLHYRVFRDKGHRLRGDRMLVLQLEHIQ